MPQPTLVAALAALAIAANAAAATNDLAGAVTARDGWVAYSVPMVAGIDGPCCYTVRSGARTKSGCDLDQSGWSVTRVDNGSLPRDGTLAVYLKVERGRVERVHAIAASCPVRAASPVRWIDSVAASNSVALLSSLLDRQTKQAEDGSLMALAYHADADDALIAVVRGNYSRPVKKQALFWLGQSGSSRAIAYFDEVLR